MKFLHNKYTTWYYQIVDSAKKRMALDTYSESHHVIPKSLGGSNSKDNLVSLTAREHFICHRLLVKMTAGSDKLKMSYAIRMMMNLENPFQERYKINSRIYQLIIADTKKIISESQRKENNPFYKKKHTEAARQKMKAKRALQVMPSREGKVYSDDSINKWREGNRKQFEDPWQKEIRRKANAEYRARVGKTTGWHNPATLEFKFFSVGEEPSGWVKGRVPKNERSGAK